MILAIMIDNAYLKNVTNCSVIVGPFEQARIYRDMISARCDLCYCPIDSGARIVKLESVFYPAD